MGTLKGHRFNINNSHISFLMGIFASSSAAVWIYEAHIDVRLRIVVYSVVNKL